MDNLCVCVNNIEAVESMDSGCISIWGTICLRVNDCFFPDYYWEDCLDILVPAWLKEMDSFVASNKQQCTLNFCDGPFTLVVNREGNHFVRIECVQGFIEHYEVQHVAIAETGVLLRTILSCAKELLRYCHGNIPNFHQSRKAKILQENYSKLKKFAVG